jgi:hypothetical protein
MIEERLPQQSFDNALHEVMLLFPAPEWTHMENETKTIIHQIQFKSMNNTLRAAGIASASLLFLGAFFKFMHWPGASAMLVVGLVLMATLFLPAFFILRYRNSGEENRNMTLSILAASCGILFCAGMLFKFQHWPFANRMLTVAIAILLLGYTPVYLLSVYRKSLNRTSALANVILMVAAGSTLFLANTRGPSRDMLEQYAIEADTEDELIKKQVAYNTELLMGIPEGEFRNAHQDLTKLINLLQAVKEEMISSSGAGKPGSDSPGNWDKSAGVNFVWNESTANSKADFNRYCKALSKHSNMKEMPTLNTDCLADMPLALAIQRLSNFQLRLLQFEQKNILAYREENLEASLRELLIEHR